MGTKKEVYFCQSCKEPITRGFIFQGNVLVIDNFEQSGGAIGNNLEENKVANETYLCEHCYQDLIDSIGFARKMR